MSKVIKGSDLMLFAKINDVVKSIAFATSHQMTISAETVETSSKDSGGKWTSKEVQRLSWTAKTDNLYSNDGVGITYDDLFAKMIAREAVDVAFGLESGYDVKTDEVPADGWKPLNEGQYKGKAYITSLDLNAPNGDKATFSASFEGVGALTKV